MLVLSRKEGESIKLTEVDVEIRVVGLTRSKVQLGIEAPASITVRRGELPQRSSDRYGPAEQQRLSTELTRLEAEVIALAELAGSESTGEEACNHAGRIAAEAMERLIGIKRSVQLASAVKPEPTPISELVTVRTEVIDRLRTGQPDDVQPTGCVRQTTAGYLDGGRSCSVA
jgi:carbon storage regulator CsrA